MLQAQPHASEPESAPSTKSASGGPTRLGLDWVCVFITHRHLNRPGVKLCRLEGLLVAARRDGGHMCSDDGKTLLRCQEQAKSAVPSSHLYVAGPPAPRAWRAAAPTRHQRTAITTTAHCHGAGWACASASSSGACIRREHRARVQGRRPTLVAIAHRYAYTLGVERDMLAFDCRCAHRPA